MVSSSKATSGSTSTVCKRVQDINSSPYLPMAPVLRFLLFVVFCVSLVAARTLSDDGKPSYSTYVILTLKMQVSCLDSWD